MDSQPQRSPTKLIPGLSPGMACDPSDIDCSLGSKRRKSLQLAVEENKVWKKHKQVLSQSCENLFLKHPSAHSRWGNYVYANFNPPQKNFLVDSKFMNVMDWENNPSVSVTFTTKRKLLGGIDFLRVRKIDMTYAADVVKGSSLSRFINTLVRGLSKFSGVLLISQMHLTHKQLMKIIISCFQCQTITFRSCIIEAGSLKNYPRGKASLQSLSFYYCGELSGWMDHPEYLENIIRDISYLPCIDSLIEILIESRGLNINALKEISTEYDLKGANLIYKGILTPKVSLT
ncbi:unnamed protein product [Moneuplotes crassus]|uniref:Uncharacterized protein n=1 Tax=Euplotes crassus TaxID=5936 RepID=A0AAD1XRM7_EUPCR|nr:unnamed protein product [Moneuplotes crassus]